MKARRKSDGKIIEVEEAVYNMKNGEPYHKCLSDGHHYPASDLDFKLDAEDAVIQGWVAKDEDGRIYLYENKPERENGTPYCKPNEWVSGNVMTKLNVASFPDLTWDDDPIEVEIIIKRKKK